MNIFNKHHTLFHALQQKLTCCSQCYVADSDCSRMTETSTKTTLPKFVDPIRHLRHRLRNKLKGKANAGSRLNHLFSKSQKYHLLTKIKPKVMRNRWRRTWSEKKRNAHYNNGNNFRHREAKLPRELRFRATLCGIQLLMDNEGKRRFVNPKTESICTHLETYLLS